MHIVSVIVAVSIKYACRSYARKNSAIWLQVGDNKSLKRPKWSKWDR